MYHILLVDDDMCLLQARAEFLSQKDCSCDITDASRTALHLLEQKKYDAILLDVKMPETSGFSLCEEVSRLSDAPIIFLSSMTEEEFQLKGFAVGGTDYISKDCSLELFWAKVAARISYYHQSSAAVCRSFPPLSLNLREHMGYVDSTNLLLTHIEFNLLALLTSRPYYTWSVEEIFCSLWGSNGDTDNQLVQAHLSRMRRKLQKAFPRHEFIETVWGKGYQFIPFCEESV